MVDNSRMRHASISDPAEDRVVQPVFVPKEVARDISIGDVMHVFRERSRLCIAIIAICTLAAAGASLLMTPVYRSEILLFPVDRDPGSGSSLLSKFGGIAALAGVKSGVSKESQLAVATLRSHEFAAAFIKENSMIPVLMSKPGVIARLLALVRPPRAPTVDGAAGIFLNSIEKVDPDPQSDMVKLSIEFRDRFKTAEWANQLVEKINDQMREKAITQSRLRLEFLNAELKKTTIVGVQGAIFDLIESETKNIMLANTERDFAFLPVEHATPPAEDEFVRPKRILMTLSGAIAGTVLALVICLFVAASGSKASRLA
jgi:uncharacterized protein involved in exopolysaccharide biosynthesis